MVAAWRGNVGIVRKLIQCRANVNLTNKVSPVLVCSLEFEGLVSLVYKTLNLKYLRPMATIQKDIVYKVLNIILEGNKSQLHSGPFPLRETFFISFSTNSKDLM